MLVITPIEMKEARDVFSLAERVKDDSPYHVTERRADQRYPLVVRKAPDRANNAANSSIKGMIEDFFPAFIFLVGTAGGVLEKDATTNEEIGREKTQLGDVIIGDFIDYVEFAKIAKGSISYRKQAHEHPSLYLRDGIAEPLAFEEPPWHDEIKLDFPEGGQKLHRDKPKAEPGNIVSGEKVWSDPKNAFQKNVTEMFPKAVVFEMEAFGAARAIFESRQNLQYNPQFLVLRGISDFTNTTQADQVRGEWSPFAARSALVFARRIIEILEATWTPKFAERPAG